MGLLLMSRSLLSRNFRATPNHSLPIFRGGTGWQRHFLVGMQMLFTSSQEDLDARGLDIISGTVKWIPPGVKRPQMQWNKLSFTQPDDPMFEGELLRGATSGSWVYFVHSLHGVPMDPSLVAATCDYGVTLNAAFRQDNVASGLALLDNFVKAAGAS